MLLVSLILILIRNGLRSSLLYLYFIWKKGLTLNAPEEKRLLLNVLVIVSKTSQAVPVHTCAFKLTHQFADCTLPSEEVIVKLTDKYLNT